MKDQNEPLTEQTSTPAGSLALPLKLRGTPQGYAWGKVGHASRIAQALAAVNLAGVDPTGPLAEYWIGSHPKAPSPVVFGENRTALITELLSARPAEILGHRVVERFGAELPFLLKILSINPDFGLSIQAHPDKELAALLHARDPQNYPDDNHKPEIAVALTPTTLLCGFKDPRALQDTFIRYPELQAVGGKATQVLLAAQSSDAPQLVVKRLYAALLTADSDVVATVVRSLSRRVESGDSAAELQWVSRLRLRYGDADVGLLAFFVMNLVTVPPGSAIFTGPNIPHAYLNGDLVECMACSDNVVRGGLTPKFKDVPTLLDMLEYTPAMPQILAPQLQADGFQHFDTPAEEFKMSVISRGSGECTIVSEEGPIVLLCLDGEVAVTRSGEGAIALRDGEAVLLPPDSGSYEVSRRDACLYRVSVNLAA